MLKTILTIVLALAVVASFAIVGTPSVSAAELIPNGDFSSAEGWIICSDDDTPQTTTIAITGGQAVYSAGAPAWIGLKRVLSVVQGETYTVTLDAKIETGSPGIQVELAGATWYDGTATQVNIPGNFNYFNEDLGTLKEDCSATFVAQSDTVTIRFKNKQGNTVGYLDNISVTGAAPAGGSGDTGSGDTGSGDTGSGDTGSGDTGSGDTGSGDTGSGDTGSGDTGSGDTADQFGTKEDGMEWNGNAWLYPEIPGEDGFPNFDFSQGLRYWGLKTDGCGTHPSEIAEVSEDGVIKFSFDRENGGLQSAKFRDDRLQPGDKVTLIYDIRGEANVSIRINQVIQGGWLSGPPDWLVIGEEATDWSTCYSNPAWAAPGAVQQNPDGNYVYQVILECSDPGPVEFEIRNLRMAKYVDGKFYDLDTGNEIVIGEDSGDSGDGSGSNSGDGSGSGSAGTGEALPIALASVMVAAGAAIVIAKKVRG